LAPAVCALAAIGAGAIGARAAPPGVACPAPTPSVFVDNGAGELLAGRGGPQRPLRLLAIGSSSTLGVGASAPANAYPAQLALDLSSQWGVAAEVRNAGVGGEASTATLARLRRELAPGGPDLVIWQVGTNDAVAGVDAAVFRANLEAGVLAARAARIPIILVDQQYYPGIRDLARYQQFVAIIADVGARLRVPVFSRFEMMKEWAAKSAAALSAALSPDGFHMDDLGYACLARALAGDIAGKGEPLGKSAAAKL
jgi:lysophospholipase L1-like esterase